MLAMREEELKKVSGGSVRGELLGEVVGEGGKYNIYETLWYNDGTSRLRCGVLKIRWEPTYGEYMYTCQSLCERGVYYLACEHQLSR